MTQIPYRAFGYLVIKNNFSAGEVFTIDPVVSNVFSVGQLFPYIWLYTKGTDVLVNVDTQEQITRTAGDCNTYKPYPQATWRTTLPEDLELWCISAFLNSSNNPPLPDVTVFALPSGEQAVVPHGTKMFIASGSINIEGRSIATGKQVEFKSGDKVVTAEGDVYGFVFP